MAKKSPTKTKLRTRRQKFAVEWGTCQAGKYMATGQRTADGYVVKGLGIYRATDTDSTADPDEWCVTHLASGRNVMRGFAKLAHARAFVLLALDMVDWTQNREAIKAIADKGDLLDQLQAAKRAAESDN